MRNKVFWLAFLIILGLIAFFQVMEQTEWGGYASSREFTLASFVPYMNAYLFSLFQIIPLLFLVTTYGGKEGKLDSMDAVYYRPESNVEYVWGVAWGFTKAFMLMAGVSLILAAMIHLFGTEAPFNMWVYLFYLFTLVFPTFVFAYGVCLLVKCYVGYRLLSLTLLLLYFIVIIFFIGDWQGGILDATGTTLPNAFSEVEGHPDLFMYLIQRLAWFLVGVGCIQLSVTGFKRLSNTPERHIRRMVLALSFLGIGVVLIGVYAMTERGKYLARREYAKVYDKYSDMNRMSLTNQEIDFRQEGDRMEVNSRLTIKNETEKTIPEMVFYLNPGLKVASVQIGNEYVSFRREQQVVVAEREVAPGDSLVLSVTYGGKIDEEICYLDIPGEVVYDTWQTRFLTCRFGKRYAFLDKQFTLLTPEVLWYPVTEPRVNLASPYEGRKNFTRYMLNVMVSSGEKTIISQGRKEVHEGGTSFYNDMPLVGLSLCIGDYESRSVIIDSVACNLYVFRRNTSFFNAIDSCGNSSVEDEMEWVESRMGKTYPFSRLSLVETPISFTSYFRDERVSSEFIQPELVFLPERFVNRVAIPEADEGVIEKMDLTVSLSGILIDFRNEILNTSWMGDLTIREKMKGAWLNMVRTINNPYYALPLFFEHDAFLQSDNHLVINKINNLVLSDITYSLYDDVDGTMVPALDAIDYLGNHSLREGLRDKRLSRDLLQEILMLKSLELVNYFNYNGVATDSLKAFIADYLGEHAFEKVDFSRFDFEFGERFGVNWMCIFPSWFENKQVPVYLIKDFRVQHLLSENPNSLSEVLVEFDIFNDSDVDGIVNLQSFGPSYGDVSVKPIKRSYLIEANTGKKVTLYLPKSLPFFGLNTNISRNIPRVVKAFNEKIDRIDARGEHILSVGKEEFLSGKNEVVVDNEDKGFHVIQSSRPFHIRGYFLKDSVSRRKYDNLYARLYLNDEWKTLVDNNAYGMSNRSVVVRNKGNGESSLEWCGKLDRNGKYEILVYVPEFSYMNVLVKSVFEHGKAGVQEYTVTLPSGEIKKAQADATNTVGWISLGYFDCTPGECKVTLSDVGTTDHQIVIGDAVKWVYLEN